MEDWISLVFSGNELGTLRWHASLAESRVVRVILSEEQGIYKRVTSHSLLLSLSKCKFIFYDLPLHKGARLTRTIRQGLYEYQ